MSLLLYVGCRIPGYNDPWMPVVNFPNGLAPQTGDSLELTMQKLLACCVAGAPVTPPIDYENPILSVWNNAGYGIELLAHHNVEDGVVVSISYTLPDGTPYAGTVVNPSADPHHSPAKLVYRLGGEAALNGVLAKALVPEWPAGGLSAGHAPLRPMVSGDHVTIDYPHYGYSWNFMRQTEYDPGDSSVAFLQVNGTGGYIYNAGPGPVYGTSGMVNTIAADVGLLDFIESFEVVGEAYVELTVWTSKEVVEDQLANNGNF